MRHVDSFRVRSWKWTETKQLAKHQSHTSLTFLLHFCLEHKCEAKLYVISSHETEGHIQSKHHWTPEDFGHQMTYYQGKTILCHHQILTRHERWFKKGMKKKRSEDKTRRIEDDHEASECRVEQISKLCPLKQQEGIWVWRKAKGPAAGCQWGS